MAPMVPFSFANDRVVAREPGRDLAHHAEAGHVMVASGDQRRARRRAQRRGVEVACSAARSWRCDPGPGSGRRRRTCSGAPNPLSSVMISNTLGAPFGGTTRGAHHAFDSEAFSLMTPPNFGSGAGSCWPPSVVVALGEPSSPVTSCAKLPRGQNANTTPATALATTGLTGFIRAPSTQSGFVGPGIRGRDPFAAAYWIGLLPA